LDKNYALNKNYVAGERQLDVEEYLGVDDAAIEEDRYNDPYDDAQWRNFNFQFIDYDRWNQAWDNLWANGLYGR